MNCNFHVCTKSEFKGTARVASIYWKLELDKLFDGSGVFVEE